MTKESSIHTSPLADRLRPRNFDEFVGQEEIVSPGKLLRQLIEQDEPPSMIFWGPPGVGKTTLAKIIAEQTKSHFVELSAVSSGKKELKEVAVEAQELFNGMIKQRTILFVDEIHRWNKAQQDALLPYVEKGVITLIGATTENPSFEVIGALLSRSRVFIFKYLISDDIVKIIQRALTDKERGLGEYQIEIAPETIALLSELAGGDARVALNALEISHKSKDISHKSVIQITVADIKESLQRTYLVFDKSGEEFYNLISAMHKSMRGSDASAALYWLSRMLAGGADPLYVARRLVRFASEDIGMANSEALVQAIAAYDACHYLGMPECSVHLAQAVVYCAKSSKSNFLYRAYEEAEMDARETSHLGVPLHLRNAPTKFMKEIGYGKDYKYTPDYDNQKDAKQEYFPKELKGKNYFDRLSAKV